MILATTSSHVVGLVLISSTRGKGKPRTCSARPGLRSSYLVLILRRRAMRL